MKIRPSDAYVNARQFLSLLKDVGQKITADQHDFLRNCALDGDIDGAYKYLRRFLNTNKSRPEVYL